MSENLVGVSLVFGTVIFIVGSLVTMHHLEQRRRRKAEAARRAAEVERARRKASGASDINPIESLIGLGLIVAAGVVVYKVAKSVLGDDKPGSSKLPSSGTITPNRAVRRRGFGGYTTDGGSYSGGGGGGGGGSSESSGSSSGGGGGSYADVESASDDDHSEHYSYDDARSDSSDEHESGGNQESRPFGDFDFRLFEDGCPDCLSPATNISIGDGKCKDCAGTGHEAWTGQDCPTCNGSGDCQTCDGTGKC